MTDHSNRPERTQRKIWNFTPSLPLQLAPYWDWPMKPLASVLYLLRSWKPLGTRFMILGAAIIIWLFFTPDLTRAQTLSFDWIAEIWLRNFVILAGVAGGLHLLLWKLGVQGDETRYDMRPMMTNAKAFWFRNQVYDNMLWSFVAMQFWVFFECAMWYAYANGWATMITFSSNPVWFLGGVVFLYAPPAVAYGVHVPACACVASQEHQHRPLVGPCDAPGRKLHPDDGCGDLFPSARPSDPCPVFDATPRNRGTNVPCGL
jgi:hypothetical protein